MFQNVIRRYRSEIIGALMGLAGWIIHEYTSRGAKPNSWFMVLLQSPSYTYYAPPEWVFTLIWSILYIMMGTAFGQLWKNRSHNKLALFLLTTQYIYSIMLTLNLERINLVFMDYYLLLSSTAILMYLVRRQRFVFLLLIPYASWVVLSILLNFVIFFLIMTHV